MGSARPTLKDVAARSGYSLRAVKKVMGGAENVRERTRESVLRAAEELNYTRNLAASALSRKQTTRIAIVYSNITEAYFPEVEQGFREAQRELMDFGLTIEFFTTDQRGWQHQEEFLQTILKREDINGVIIQPISSTRLNPLIDELTREGKPVVTFGADAPASKRLCYVGPDAYRSGRIAGQILANYIGKHGKVFIINQAVEHMQTRERCRGFMDRMKEHYPNIQPFEMNLPENTNLYYEMVHSLVANEDVAGIFCTDANTYLAGQVLKDMDKRDVSLVGFDLSESGIRLMQEGYIKVLIEQKPDMMSSQALKQLFRYLTDSNLPEKINNTPVFIMTSECIVT